MVLSLEEEIWCLKKHGFAITEAVKETSGNWHKTHEVNLAMDSILTQRRLWLLEGSRDL